MPHKQAGFNLVEMAIVLVIAAFLLFSLFTPLAVRQDNARIKQTKDTLAEVKATLLGYAIVKQRLPCPDTDTNGPTDGFVMMNEDTDCIAHHEGELPWAMLGVGQYDAWGQPFRYRLDQNYERGKSAGGFITKLQNREPAAQVLATSSNLEVVDTDDRYLSSANNSIVAIIFSCGKNRKPDNHNFNGSTKGDNSCANAGTLSDLSGSIRYSYQEDVPKEGFDDIVVWITQYELISTLLRSQQFPASPP